LRRIGTESHPSVLYIRAGNIELYGRDFRDAVQPGGKFRIFFCGFAVNINNQRNVQLRKNFRQYPPHKLIIPDIFQANTVEHTGRRFCNPHSCITVPRLKR